MKSDNKTNSKLLSELEAKDLVFSHLMNEAPVGLCYLDCDLRYVYINDWLADINGLPSEEHLGRSMSELFPDLATVTEPQFRHVIETGLPIIKGRAIADVDGKPGAKRIFEHSYIPRKSTDGTVLGISCFIEDVTERTNVEEDLKETKHRYDLAVHATSDGVWDWDMITNREYFSPRWCEIIGFRYEDADLPHNYDSWASRIHPDDYQRVMDALKAHLEKGVKYDVDYRHQHKSGEFRWQNSKGAVITDSNGSPVRMVGCIRDITELKRVQEELVGHRDNLERLVNERTSQLQNANRSSQLERQLLQYIVNAEDIEQALKKCLIELSEFLEYEHAEIWIPQEDTNCLKSHYQWSSGSEDSMQFAECSSGRTLEKGQDVAGSVWRTEELEWRSIDCSESDLDDPRHKSFARLGIKSILGVPVKTNTALLAIFCFYSPNSKAPSKETTELISAITLQAALAIDRLHVTSVFEHIIESAPGAMLVTSINGTIKMLNRAGGKLFGYNDSELLGSAIEALIPDIVLKMNKGCGEDDERHSLLRPTGFALEINGKQKDGTEIPLDVSFNMQMTVFGSQFIVGIVDLREHQKNLSDLSASRERLRDLTNHMTRIAERERKSIARDLHDDLGQVLTSLTIDISILESQVRAPGNHDNSESISEDLAAMSETLGKASERLHGFVSKLRPEILDNLGLITALEWQTEEFFKSHKIECEFICELDHLEVHDEIDIAIYRIVQECLTNISRHAKARNCKITVGQNNNTLIVEVSDDGIGVSNEALASTNRFGLLGVRERASALNGSVQIESTSGEGTTVRIIIPLESGDLSSD